MRLSGASPARAFLILLSAVWQMSLSSCGSVSIEKTLESAETIYKDIAAEGGSERLLSRIYDKMDREHLGIASIEVPLEAEKLWPLLLRQINEYKVPIDRAVRETGFIATKLYPERKSFSEHTRYYIKLTPTEAGTTIFDIGVARYMRIDYAGHAVKRNDAFPYDFTQQREITLRLEDLNFLTLLLLSEEERASQWPKRARLVPLRAETAQRLAIAGLIATARDLALATPVEQWAVTNRALNNRLLRPSELELTTSFDDSNGLLPNGALDAGEEALLRVVVREKGNGPAQGVLLKLASESPELSLPPSVTVGDLDQGGQTTIELLVTAPTNATSQNTRIQLTALEERGYNSPLYEFQFPTRHLIPPQIQISSVEIGASAFAGRLYNGGEFQFLASLQNTGAGPAAQIVVRIESGPNAPHFAVAETIPTLMPGEQITVPVTVHLPRRYPAGVLAIEVTATDGRGPEVSNDTHTLTANVDARQPDYDLLWQVFDGNRTGSTGNRNNVLQNGEQAVIEFKLRNRGEIDARNVRIAFEDETRALRVTPGVRDLGHMPPQSESAPWEAQLVIPRSYSNEGPIRLHGVIEDAEFGKTDITVTLPFRTARPKIQISPGELGALNKGVRTAKLLVVTNVGDLVAKDLELRLEANAHELRLENSDGIPIERLVYKLGSLEPQQAKEITATLWAPHSLWEGELTIDALISQSDFSPMSTQLAIQLLPEEVVSQPTVPVIHRETAREQTPPALFITQPKEIDYIEASGPTLTVGGWTHDSDRVWRVLVDGELADSFDGRNFRHRAKIGPTKPEIVVQAEDYAHNTTTQTLYVHFNPDRRKRDRQDRALLFAVDDYSSWPKLFNPILDAHRMKELLEQLYDFETILVPNPQLEDARRILLREVERTDFGPGDQLLIFFAGHGTYDELLKDGALIFADSRCHQGTIDGTCLRHNDLARILEAIPVPRLLVVLDSCFSGTFERGPLRGDTPDYLQRERLEMELSKPLRQYLVSGELRVHDGEPGAHSPFARRLLAALRGAPQDRPLLLSQLCPLIDRPETPIGCQHFGGQQSGNFVFVPAALSWAIGEDGHGADR